MTDYEPLTPAMRDEIISALRGRGPFPYVEFPVEELQPLIAVTPSEANRYAPMLSPNNERTAAYVRAGLGKELTPRIRHYLGQILAEVSL